MTSLLFVIQTTGLLKITKNILKNIEKQLKKINSYSGSNENDNRAFT